MFGRAKVALMVGEFFGAATLSIVTLSMLGRTSFPFFVAVAAAVCAGAMFYLFGALSNPAVTVGMWTMRRLPTPQAIVMVAVQVLGGLAAWQLMEYLLNNSLKNIAGSSFDWRILVAEAVGALVLGLGLAAANVRAYAGSQFAAIYGVVLFLGILVASIASNGLVNPSVAIGVQSWNWVYALGPVLGSVVGMSFYGLVFGDRPARTRAATVRGRTSTRKAAVKKPTRRKAKK